MFDHESHILSEGISSWSPVLTTMISYTWWSVYWAFWQKTAFKDFCTVYPRSSFCCTHVFFLSTWQILCLISHTLDAGGDLMPSLSEHRRLGLFCLPAELSAGLNVNVDSTSAKQRRHLNIVTLECKIFKFNNNVNTGLKTLPKAQRTRGLSYA